MNQPMDKNLIEDIIAMSPTQEGILYHCLKNPELSLYLSQVSLQVKGRMEKQLMLKALEIVSQENECLRSVFRWEKISQPVQVVLKHMEFEMSEEDVSSLSVNEKMKRIHEIQKRERIKGFNLNKGPLVRVVLCREGDEKHRILLQFHHIILDGWSLGLLLSEWFQTYDMLLRNEKVPKLNKPKYKSYIKWLQSVNHEQSYRFWQQELNSLSSYTKIPYRPQAKQFGGDVHHVTISLEEIMQKVTDFSKTYGVTSNSVINAAWGLVLQRYNDSDEAVFGLTVSGRPEELFGMDRMIGLFINTIPFVITEGGESTVVDYIRNVHNQMIRYKEAERLPLSEIQSASQLKGTEALFRHILVFENYPLDQQLMAGSFSGFTITDYEEAEVNHYDLTVSFMLAGEPALKLDYNTNLFDRQTIENMAQHFVIVLQQLIDRPEQYVSTIDLVTAEEKRLLLEDYNQTEKSYHEQEKTVYELFVQQAQATPDNTAVVFRNERLSYGELAEQAGKLANHLQQQGKGEGSIVAILMDWSTEMITAIMGVLGSGSAYLPIDPNYPEERIRYIVKNSKADTIVTTAQYHDMAAPMVGTIVILEQGHCRTVSNEKSLLSNNSDCKVVDFPLAYVIYTSGSTGQPKGVMIDQRSFTEFVLWAVEEYEHRIGYQVVLSNSYAFDSSVQQIFPPLVSGGTLHLLHPDVRKDAQQYLEYLKRNRINNLDEIPVLMNVLVEQAKEETELPVLPDLTSLSLGSEYVPISLVQKCKKLLNSKGKIINGYGPAETTVETCTYHFIGNADDEISLVGKPRSNLKVYIVDRENRLCPVGVPGEICVAGLGLSRGYLNQPELTDEKFIPNPFSDVPGAKMYKTGDAGQWLFDGNIQYIGRIDNQIKIRGYRVEPGEIEEALLRHPLIQDAVVIVQGKQQNLPVLCAFLKSKGEPTVQELRMFLADKLPDYMIPSFYQYVEGYPQTPNGKINRKALEQIEIEQEQGQLDDSLPRHELDEKLIQVWRSVLQLSKIGIHTPFFEVGGNSIQLMRVYSRLKKEMPDVSLEISDFFSYNTISQLSDYLMNPTEKIEELQLTDYVEEQPKNDTKDRDIAIIGLGIRLPEILGPEAFWNFLEEGKETIKDIQQSRRNLDPTGHEEKNYLRYGYMEGIDEFDPQFFGISPKFAKYIDPNQRIMLETAYHALEDAGYTRGNLKNRPVGVFMGAVLPNYHQFLDVKLDELLASNLPANLAGRLSYHFGFNGPSLVIDTACSSSLVALHTAVQSLRNGECEMAMVGGVHLDIAPVNREDAMESNIVSPSESCRAFSEEADGTIGGEGCICVLLKPMEQALQDNDSIYTVIKGSGVVQDGARSNGITSPSPDAQAETLLSAWRDAGIDPTTVSYIEAHGTGTKIGDPIEIKGIQKAYQPFTNQKQFIGLGSVKSNIGHLDSAAGLAGLAKVALSLKYSRVPASLHAGNLNPLIDFERSPVFINSVLSTLESKGEHPARAGISSFGLSGTNVHVVLEKFENLDSSSKTGGKNKELDPYLVTLSGSSADLLNRKMDDLQSYLKERKDANLEDISYTLNCRRSHEIYRFSTLVKDSGELIKKLENAAKANMEKTQSPKAVTVFLQDYCEGADRLYDKLCKSGILSDEEIEQFNKNIAEYSNIVESGHRAKYVSFLCGLVQLLSRTGLKFDISGIGIGAATAKFINGSCTLNSAVNYLSKGANAFEERSLLQDGGIILSVGPNPIDAITEAKQLGNSVQWAADVFTLVEGKARFMDTLRRLYLEGVNLNFEAIQGGNVVSLPVYPFERKSYWLDTGKNKYASSIRQSKASYEVDHLLHRLVWRPSEFKRDIKRVIDGAVLIAGNNDGLQSRLAEMFSNDGLTVVKIRYGTHYQHLGQHLYEINVHKEGDIERVLWELEQAGHVVSAFISLPSDTPMTNNSEQFRYPERLSKIVEEQVKPVWYAGRQLGLRSTANPVHLFHITNLADKVVATDPPVDPMQSVIVSLNRSLNREYPQLQGNCIDFDLSNLSLDEMADRIYDEVFWQQEIKESAYRNGNRYEKQLYPEKIKLPARETFRNDGVYLVTGGSGGIGMEICRSIANENNATFILLGRTKQEDLNERQLDEIRQLTDLGANVQYMATNIADFSKLSQVIERITNTYGRVDGVIHAAGVLGNQISLQEAKIEDYHNVFEAKVYGTVLLDLLLRDHALDFFILFSSVDAVLSEKNIGTYSSANYFMDQYALQQRQLGRKFVSIQWGGWQMTGMGDATRQGSHESHIHEIKRLSPLVLGFDRKEGISAFHKLVDTNTSHTLVTGLNDQDLQEFKSLAFFKLSQELLAEANKEIESVGCATLEEITVAVATIWTEVLELDEEPGLTDNYFSLGGDSIQGIDITVELSERFQLQLDANILFRQNNIESLSRFIHEQLNGSISKGKGSLIPKATPLSN
ncbi:amino acid adenylation domain-containing protein [Peribacillus simplex]|uniref:amino acid adenylation domain-containing protein n=1 Tax=Peribacillus simplex TaxID=1478 RepID=UPI003D299799